MMEFREVRLEDIAKHPNKIYVKLGAKFLTDILKKASKSGKPHRNLDFCKKLGVKINNKAWSSLTVSHWIKFNRAIPLSKLYVIQSLSNTSWNNIESNLISLRAGFAGKEVFIKFPIMIEKELGSIAGHILGDGSIDKRYKQVFFSNSNKELLNEFYYYMKNIFGIRPRIWMQRKTIAFKEKTRWERRLSSIEELKGSKNCGLFYPTICGLMLNMIFDNFSIGKEKRITSKIKIAPEEFKAGLIRAFCDDEGTVGSKSIRIHQDRKDILLNISRFLRGFYIYPGTIKEYMRKSKTRCYVDIHRKSNLIKFRDNIGFTSTKKMQRLRDICVIKNYKNSK